MTIGKTMQSVEAILRRLAFPLSASFDKDRDRRSRQRAGQIGWALFDWASSPFSVLIITFVFPAYFAAAIVGDQARGQAIWGYALAASGGGVALLAAPLGAIADAGGRRKPWIIAFVAVGMIATSLLWFAAPGRESLVGALACVIVANVALVIAAMFVNAMLPDIADEAYIGRLSGWAWGFGYAGGLVTLAIALLAFVVPREPLLHLDRQEAEHVRIVGPLVAAWFAAFAWPFFVFTPDRPSRSLRFSSALREGLERLGQLLGELRAQRGLLLFLLANMMYADGLVSLFAFGGVYVSGVFGMSLSEVILFGVVLNVAAGLGATAFGWVDDRLGSRRTIALALVGLILSAVAAVSVQTRPWLWVTGCLLGIFVGPVQASSRSLMARLAPADRQGEYFGLLALSGKATAFAGPVAVALVTDATGSQRLGLATILAFLAIGLSLLAASGRNA